MLDPSLRNVTSPPSIYICRNKITTTHAIHLRCAHNAVIPHMDRLSVPNKAVGIVKPSAIVWTSR